MKKEPTTKDAEIQPSPAMSSIDDVMNRDGQASVRLYHVGFTDGKDNYVSDYYPCSDGKVWRFTWPKAKKEISPSMRARYEEILERHKRAPDFPTWRAIEIPCAENGCASTVWQSLDTIEHATEKNWESGLNDEFFCARCFTREAKTSRLIEQWKQVCPRIFREGETATDPRFFPKIAWGEIRLWASRTVFSNKSLYVYGDTGVCKSRMMFEILRTTIIENGFSFKVYSGGEFRREQEQIQQTRFDKKPERILSNADTVDVLVFDDLGQDDLNGSMRSNLRWLIDKRLSNGMKTIFLANVKPSQLGLTYGEGISINTLSRRIEDFCDVVEVRAKKQTLDQFRKNFYEEENPF